MVIFKDYMNKISKFKNKEEMLNHLEATISVQYNCKVVATIDIKDAAGDYTILGNIGGHSVMLGRATIPAYEF